MTSDGAQSAAAPNKLFAISLPGPARDRKGREEDDQRAFTTTWCIILAQSLIICLILIAFTLHIVNAERLNNAFPHSYSHFKVDVDRIPFANNSVRQSMLARFKKAAVVSDNGICSEIGRRVLTVGGNAVDAAIATLLCVGATNPQSSGIGGGLFMTVYLKDRGHCVSINARETAPRLAHEDMYRKNNASAIGYKSIGVPGEISGMWRAFTDYGSRNIAWQDLVMPTANTFREGIPVSEYLAQILQTPAIQQVVELPDGMLRRMFTNSSTGRFYEEGDIMKRLALADTLEALANADDPVELFYRGSIAKTIVEEMEQNGGLITAEDLDDYESVVNLSAVTTLSSSLSLCGPPPPSSWIVTQLIVTAMNQLFPNAKKSQLETVDFYHKLIEIEKFAYARRSHLGDPYYVRGMEEFAKNLTSADTAKRIAGMVKDTVQEESAYGSNEYAKEDHGTSHVSVLDEHGNAVSVTSTINLWLGSTVASSLGIVWNDEMDDFSVTGKDNSFGYAPTHNNLIEPGKTPVSSMSPTVVRMVVGTTGGSKIIQGVAVAIIRSLLFGETIKEAIDAPQIYHQMHPNYAQYESDFPEEILNGLRAKGHQLQQQDGMHSTTHALFVDINDGHIYANSDRRSHVHMHPDGY